MAEAIKTACHAGNTHATIGVFKRSVPGRVLRVILILVISAFLAACPPNSLLTDVQSEVEHHNAANQGTVAAPQFNPPAQEYNADQNVMISSATSGATIHYTT